MQVTAVSSNKTGSTKADNPGGLDFYASSTFPVMRISPYGVYLSGGLNQIPNAGAAISSALWFNDISPNIKNGSPSLGTGTGIVAWHTAPISPPAPNPPSALKPGDSGLSFYSQGQLQMLISSSGVVHIGTALSIDNTTYNQGGNVPYGCKQITAQNTGTIDCANSKYQIVIGGGGWCPIGAGGYSYFIAGSGPTSTTRWAVDCTNILYPKTQPGCSCFSSVRCACAVSGSFVYVVGASNFYIPPATIYAICCHI